MTRFEFLQGFGKSPEAKQHRELVGFWLRHGFGESPSAENRENYNDLGFGERPEAEKPREL